MTTKSDSIYPISVVMNMTGLTARQIRYYESQGLITPARSKGNQRLYTAVDVDNLQMIKKMLEKGLNLDGIKVLLNGEKEKETSSVQQRDTEELFSSQRPAVPRLTSLYPVNNQEALADILKYKRK